MTEDEKQATWQKVHEEQIAASVAKREHMVGGTANAFLRMRELGMSWDNIEFEVRMQIVSTVIATSKRSIDTGTRMVSDAQRELDYAMKYMEELRDEIEALRDS